MRDAYLLPLMCFSCLAGSLASGSTFMFMMFIALLFIISAETIYTLLHL